MNMSQLQRMIHFRNILRSNWDRADKIINTVAMTDLSQAILMQKLLVHALDDAMCEWGEAAPGDLEMYHPCKPGEAGIDLADSPTCPHCACPMNPKPLSAAVAERYECARCHFAVEQVK